MKLRPAMTACAVLLGAIAIAPAQASIGVGTAANCFDGLNNYNYSWIGQQPYQAEWTFALSQTSYTVIGPKTVAGSQLWPGYLTAILYFAPSFKVYQAVGNHFGSDGYAYYAVTTSATTCTADVRTFQDPVAGRGAAAAGGRDAAVLNSTNADSDAGEAAAPPRSALALLKSPGVRVDSVVNIWSLAEQQRAQRLWVQRAPGAAAAGVAQVLADQAMPSFEGMLSSGRDRLAFVAAHIGSTELAKAGLAKSLSAGTRLDHGWTGYSRIFQLGAAEWVMLDELDLDAMQGSAVIFREAINADVNGAPAQLRSASAAGGSSLTALTWIANGKRYALKTNAAPATASERLLAIARGLY